MEFSETGFHLMLGCRLVGDESRGGEEVHVFVCAKLVGRCATCEDQAVVSMGKLGEDDVEHQLDAVRELHRLKFNSGFPSALYLQK